MIDKLNRKIHSKYYYDITLEEAHRIAKIQCKVLQIPDSKIDSSYKINKTKKGIVIRSPYKSVLNLKEYLIDFYNNQNKISTILDKLL